MAVPLEFDERRKHILINVRTNDRNLAVESVSFRSSILGEQLVKIHNRLHRRNAIPVDATRLPIIRPSLVSAATAALIAALIESTSKRVSRSTVEFPGKLDIQSNLLFRDYRIRGDRGKTPKSMGIGNERVL